MQTATNSNSFSPSNLNQSKANVKGEVTGTRYVWPTIDKEAFKNTMDNYREHVSCYNEVLKRVNAKIENHNSMVLKNKKSNPPCVKKAILISLFNSKYSSLKKRRYNKEAIDFCDLHGDYIEQVIFAPVKPPSINVFEAILHAYQVKIRKHTQVLQGMGIKHVTSLPKAEIHPYEIVSQMRNGYKNLNYSTRTIRAHRERLTEAGILTEYEFCGSKRPVKNSISSQILYIKDHFKTLITHTENQILTSRNRKKVPHNEVSTYSIRKKLENKGIVNNNPQYMDFAVGKEPSISNYLNTLLQGGNSEKINQGQKNKPGAKNLKKVPLHPKTVDAMRAKQTRRENNTATPATILDKIGITPKNEVSTTTNGDPATPYLKLLQHHAALKTQLTNGDYNFYVPTDVKILQMLVNSNILTNAQYREYCLQDFIKSTAKIWRQDQGSQASWCIAISQIDKLFSPPNFMGKAAPKADVYQKLIELRYRLNWAFTWFKNKEYKGVWYPNIYFDILRDKPEDVCFAYSKKIWRAAMGKKQSIANKNRIEKKKKKIREAEYSVNRINNRKMDAAIWAYLRKDKTLIQLQTMVAKLPQIQQQKFSNRLEKLNENRDKKQLK
jgi:DNA-binding transcriptional ArsR family regulator